MRNRKDYYAISVESRKGGVGKTTAALCMALELVKSLRYEVIYLDLDITGTAAADIESSLNEQTHIWKGSLNVVKDPFDKSGTKNVNLVTLFERYMSGTAVPPATWKNSGEKHFRLESERINILSSYLCRDNDGENAESNIYGPETLFDEMHSEWLISMLKDIVENCLDSLKWKRELAVIIDNAPGFSGLEPAVEEWLTNLGPECGKFMFVGTMDIQDIKACVRSIQSVHRLYSEKWSTAISFKDAIIDKKQLPTNMNPREKRFLSLLAEIADKEDYDEEGDSRKFPMSKHENCINCGLCFYRLCAGHEKIGEGFKNNPSQYIALIANKVPPPVYDESYDFILNDLLKELGHDVKGKPITLKTLRSFLDRPRNQRDGSVSDVLRYLPDRMIPFQERWSLQFLAEWLKDVKSSKRSGATNLMHGEEGEQIRHLTESTKQFHDSVESFNSTAGVNYDNSEHVINMGIKVVTSYDEALRDTIRKTPHKAARSFEEFGLISRYASFISSISCVFHAMSPRLSPSEGAYTEEEIRTKLPKVVGIIVGPPFSLSIARGLSTLDAQSAGISSRSEVRSVMDETAKGIAVAVALAAIIVRNIRGFSLESYEVTALTILLFSMETELIRTWRTDKNLTDELGFRNVVNRELRPNLIRESEHVLDIATHVLANLPLRRNPAFEKDEKGPAVWTTLRNITTSQAKELYLSFSEAQVMFVDVLDAFRFITGCLETIRLQKDSSHILAGILKDLAQMVIVDKFIPYDIGWNRLEALGLQRVTRFPKEHPEVNETSLLRDLLDAKEMKEFKNISLSILGKGQWKLL